MLQARDEKLLIEAGVPSRTREARAISIRVYWNCRELVNTICRSIWGSEKLIRKMIYCISRINESEIYVCAELILSDIYMRDTPLSATMHKYVVVMLYVQPKSDSNALV